MPNVLEIKNLRKSFGDIKVIDGLSFSVPEGSIFGFVGINGAGKTTTMKMVLGLLEIDGGEIIVCGERVSYGKTVNSIGYLPDIPEFYPYMKPMEFLTLCGKIAGMRDDAIRARGQELLRHVGIKAKRKIGGFSRGMKQRLGIAQALLNEPKLLICDEPTSALDPMGRKEILDILTAVKGRTTVVFSTHILSDVERICDRVVFLHGGKVALSGSLAEIKKQRADSYCAEFFDKRDADRFAAYCSGVGGVGDGGGGEGSSGGGSGDVGSGSGNAGSGDDGEGVNGGGINSSSVSVLGNIVTIKNADGARLIKLLAETGLTPDKFELLEPTLEDLFLEVIH